MKQKNKVRRLQARIKAYELEQSKGKDSRGVKKPGSFRK
jgi:hypothetical protein